MKWFLLTWANAFIAIKSFENGWGATISSYLLAATIISAIGAWIATQSK